jgi:hypothetical protein
MTFISLILIVLNNKKALYKFKSSKTIREINISIFYITYKYKYKGRVIRSNILMKTIGLLNITLKILICLYNYLYNLILYLIILIFNIY